jgi:hypothetical protein
MQTPDDQNTIRFQANPFLLRSHATQARFASLLDYRDPRFLPGGAKYLDVPGLLALSAPHPLWVAGEPAGETIAARAYAAAGGSANLQHHSGSAEGELAAALDWLLR